MNVISNWHWRDFLYRHDIPQVILESEFEWLDADEQCGFFRYRGVWYHLSMFLHTSIAPWDGIHNDSAFSGVAVELSPDGEQYRVATLIS